MPTRPDTGKRALPLVTPLTVSFSRNRVLRTESADELLDTYDWYAPTVVMRYGMPAFGLAVLAASDASLRLMTPAGSRGQWVHE
jgi:hypothetical protein